MAKKTLKSIAKDIKSLKIQGASKVRKAAIDAIRILAKNSRAKTATKFQKEVKQGMLILHNSRPTEPDMRTALRILLKKSMENRDLDGLKQGIVDSCHNYETEREKAMKKIADFGAKMLPKKSVIITHCHSHTVEEILIKAHKQRKIDLVYSTETRPRFQGRKTSTRLAKAGIEVNHIVDSAAMHYMKECDFFFTGCDAILNDGSIVNKIGTRMISLAADKMGVPHLVATSTHKFDPLTIFGEQEIIEQRNPKEIWEKRMKNLSILNPAFDITPSNLAKKIICERGIFGSETLVATIYDLLELEKKNEKDLSLFYLLKKG